MKKDWDYIAKLEKAISQKYGEEAIQNPNKNWDDDKEAEYLQQLEILHKKELKTRQQEELVEVNGFLVPKKLLNKDRNKNCPVCNVYLKTVKDDIYMLKYECCTKCYIEYVEDREERWFSGWRPNLGEDKCHKKI